MQISRSYQLSVLQRLKIPWSQGRAQEPAFTQHCLAPPPTTLHWFWGRQSPFEQPWRILNRAMITSLAVWKMDCQGKTADSESSYCNNCILAVVLGVGLREQSRETLGRDIWEDVRADHLWGPRRSAPSTSGPGDWEGDGRGAIIKRRALFFFCFLGVSGIGKEILGEWVYLLDKYHLFNLWDNLMGGTA